MNGSFPIPVVEQSLYEVRKAIYPRAVSGWFARWRWGLVVFTQLLFYGLAWLPWNGRQAVLFDLVARKFYVFGLVLWPQDVVYLAVLLILSALALFLFTAIAGRLWCGYACPQTVYTEIFLWIERKLEGDRAARMKLDAAPRSPRKLALKTAKHAIWIALSLWTGLTFVGYFTPIRELTASIATLSFGPWETFWILFYSFATYGNAGWMREQVCKYMCPYARFQSAMFDQDTLVISYDSARGDPRGGRARRADPKGLGLGDCVDCNICVQVCPTGIDIRDGLQFECIGCAACIDGCDTVMDKMGYPRGLIRYSTENALKNKWTWEQILRRIVRTRVVIYTAIFATIGIATVVTLVLRVPVKMDVMRDRASLAREVEGGRIENVYRIQLMNMAEAPAQFSLSAVGARGNALEIIAEAQPLSVPPLATRMFLVRLRADPGPRGSEAIEFALEGVPGRDAAKDVTTEASKDRTTPSAPVARAIKLREKSRFLFP